jgi:hypothetical protein
MAHGQVPVTPGSGLSIDAHQVGDGGWQQIVRTVRADTRIPVTWTPVTTAAALIAADEARVGLLIYNASSVRVYLQFTNAATVTTTNADWYLDSGDRWDVPEEWVPMAVSAVGASAGSGTVNFTLGTET